MRLLRDQDLQRLWRELRGALETHRSSGSNLYRMQRDVRSWERPKYAVLQSHAETISDDSTLQFLNGAGQSSKDRVALSMIEMVCEVAL